MFLVSTGLGILVITQNILIADFLAKIIRHQFQGLWIVLFILLGVLLLRATVQFLNQWLGDYISILKLSICLDSGLFIKIMVIQSVNK